MKTLHVDDIVYINKFNAELDEVEARIIKLSDSGWSTIDVSITDQPSNILMLRNFLVLRIGKYDIDKLCEI